MHYFIINNSKLFLYSQQQKYHVIDEEMADGPVILRKRRALEERNTCQLFIQTDHLFFKYYNTREAVIAQVHLKHRWLSGI